MLLLFPLLACPIELSSSRSSFSLVGTSSQVIISWTSRALSTWTLVFYPSGKQQVPAKLAAIQVHGSSYSVATGEFGSFTTQFSDSIGSGGLIVLELSKFALAYFPMPDRVYPVCLFQDLKFSNLTSKSSGACGSYHTFTPSVPGNEVDRNLGKYMSSKLISADISFSSKEIQFNISLYCSTGLDSSKRSSFNCGVVIQPLNPTQAWSAWAALSVGVYLGGVNSDFLLINQQGLAFDGFSSKGSVSKAVQDFTYSNSCKQNAAVISAGKTNSYFYSHFIRPTVTLDQACDSDFNSRQTPFCLLFKLGGSQLKDFGSQEDDHFCVLLFSSWASLVILLLFVF